MKILYILLMIAGPVLILEGPNIFTMIAGIFLLLISAVMLVDKHNPNPSEYDKVEKIIDPTLNGLNKGNSQIVIFGLIVSIVPGVFATAAIALDQWKIGSLVLLVWVYPYWLLLKYLNKRSLIQVRLGFSLTATFLILAFTFWAY